MNNAKFFILLSILGLFVHSTIFCQDDYDDFYYEEEQEKTVRDRIFFGGNFGLSFSTNISYVEVSPLIGYWITDNLAAGTGPVYQYIKYYDDKYNSFGGRIYTRYIIFRNFFIHAEEQLTVQKYILTSPQSSNEESNLINDLMIGGGLRMPIGQRSSINLMLLYNLTESSLSTKRNPVIMIDFNF